MIQTDNKIMLQEQTTCDIAAESLMGKAYTIKEFAGLFNDDDIAVQYLKIVTFILKSPLSIKFIDKGEDNGHPTLASFMFSEDKKAYEPIYIFRLFANLEYIVMISDEVLGATNRVKGIELILNKFKNEALTKFLDAIGADALDKAVVVILIHLFLTRRDHLVDLFEIFELLPKSFYVTYVNRLCQGNCILYIQKLVKYHKADVFSDSIHFSLTPRLFDLLSNEAVTMI